MPTADTATALLTESLQRYSLPLAVRLGSEGYRAGRSPAVKSSEAVSSEIATVAGEQSAVADVGDHRLRATAEITETRLGQPVDDGRTPGLGTYQARSIGNTSTMLPSRRFASTSWA